MTKRIFWIALGLSVALIIAGCGKSASSSTAGPAPQTSAANASLTSAAGNAAPTASLATTGTAQGSPTGSAVSGTSGAFTCPTTNSKVFAKTRFVLHTGEAFGAFHRYLYKPYQAGTFRAGTTGAKVAAFAKAGLAGLFIKRQVRLASEDVQASPALCKAIAAPLASLDSTIGSAVTKLKAGDASGITDANTQIASIENGAAKSGDPITEDPNAQIS